MQCLEASHSKKYSNQRFFGIVDTPAQITGRRLNEFGKREDYNKDLKITQCLEVRGGDKIHCLTTVKKRYCHFSFAEGEDTLMYFNTLEEGIHYRYIYAP